MASPMILSPKAGYTKPTGPVALIVLDGVGVAEETEWNAFAQAHTPFVDSLRSGSGPHGSSCLYTELDASGYSVGLPTMDDMGNSEVGHNALGAGRVFDQGAKLVNKTFSAGTFSQGETWKWLIECSPHSTLHLIGLFSDGGVHAHVDHVYSLLDAAVEDGVKRIRIHALADGRDVSERSVLDYIGPLEKRLEGIRAHGVDARIASGGGRMVVTMDRYEADWGIVERGWNTHVLGNISMMRSFTSYTAAIDEFYNDRSMTDQMLPGFVIVDDDGHPLGTVEDGDSVLLWNFRGDRALEISSAFEAPEGQFPHFDRVRVPKIKYAGMMQYDGDAGIPKKFLVSPPSIDRTVSEYVVMNGLKRFSVSETQKYGHVTYFFNGNRAAKFVNEKELYVCIPSYQQRENTRPWMKCAEITDSALKELDEFKPDLMVMNYPGGDMCGHCANMNAARIACECIDLSLARIVPEIIKRGGIVLITADHGNCEIMAEVDKKTGLPKPGNQPEGWKPHVAHTTQRVPLFMVGKGIERYAIDETARWGDVKECTRAGIANVAPTLLNLLGMEAPKEYLPAIVKLKESS
jgi:2,3-bisphosphoglycerate-independent phosphoglycerate mutase